MDDVHGSPILLVVPEGDDGFAASFLERLDHEVITCHGPGPGAGCPLLHGDGCPWYEGAHGIVFSLDLTRAEHRAIVRTYADAALAAGRDLPIRVVVPEGAPVPAGYDGTIAWSGEPNVAQLDGFAALVEAAERFA